MYICLEKTAALSFAAQCIKGMDFGHFFQIMLDFKGSLKLRKNKLLDSFYYFYSIYFLICSLIRFGLTIGIEN